ncbi:MAG: preprotein translocase subunit YajC [Victivallaceae bacterium]|nr:preprotein translocase subunit YajC [Victivallaceae bacterium]NLK82638.1 preprotein translocase subunit YajC [Lentisphaerota bacterium]MDD3116126.1 preprotein translocase subunit YajC [Victivallaceae bacterium]MDD3702870.1 preprotein translocase subunit YajC [Victivallaceae bacterium]MDD4318545.1 preprotein translocase subunit YajC [Victivallaceae bacterium]
MLNAITIATANAPEAQGSQNFLVTMVPFAVIIIIMIWMTSRGQKKQQQKRQQMIDSLQRGQRVIVAGGLYGKIAEIKDQSFLVEIADSVKIEVAKFGISSVVDDNAVENKK